jgi:hypothetical protein
LWRFSPSPPLLFLLGELELLVEGLLELDGGLVFGGLGRPSRTPLSRPSVGAGPFRRGLIGGLTFRAVTPSPLAMLMPRTVDCRYGSDRGG